MVVRKFKKVQKLDPYQRGYLAAQRVQQTTESKEDEESDCGCLCFFLGCLLGPFGMLIAAIVGKKHGVIASLWGWLVSWIIVALIFGGIVGVGILLDKH